MNLCLNLEEILKKSQIVNNICIDPKILCKLYTTATKNTIITLSKKNLIKKLEFNNN